MQTKQQFNSPSPHSTVKDTELDLTRSQALQVISVDQLQRLDCKKLTILQRILQHGEEFGVWVTPRKWTSAGGAKNALLSIDLRRRITQKLHRHYDNCISDLEAESLSSYLDQAVLVLTRYLLLLRMGPAGVGSGRQRPLDVSTILQHAYDAGPALLACAIAKHASDPLHLDPAIAGLRFELPLLHPITLTDLTPLPKRARASVLAECRRMQILSAHDLWKR